MGFRARCKVYMVVVSWKGWIEGVGLVKEA